MKWSTGFYVSMGAAASLLPLTIAAESHIQTEAVGTAAAATAHVNFKIVIPKVLYLRVDGGSDRGAGTVAVMSNSRSVTLNATVRTPDPDRTSDPYIYAHGNVVLGASATRVIAQDAPCTVGMTHAAATSEVAGGGGAKANVHQVVCTVSMP